MVKSQLMNDGGSVPGFDFHFGEEPLPHEVLRMLEDVLELTGKR